MFAVSFSGVSRKRPGCLPSPLPPCQKQKQKKKIKKIIHLSSLFSLSLFLSSFFFFFWPVPFTCTLAICLSAFFFSLFIRFDSAFRSAVLGARPLSLHFGALSRRAPSTTECCPTVCHFFFPVIFRACHAHAANPNNRDTHPLLGGHDAAAVFLWTD